MANQIHLDNAPIQEAIIEIRTIASDNLNIEHFSSDDSEFSLEGYSYKDVVRGGALRLDIKKDGKVDPSILDQQLLGYRYENDDHKYVANFQKTRFIISRLAPYKNWERFREEAKKIWEIYVKEAKPIKSVRVATRFVNVLKIPLPIEDFADYFTTPPVIPEELPQGLSSYLSRFVFAHEDGQYSAAVTQSLEKIEKHPDGDFAPIIFDIDVSFNQQIEVNDIIWEHLDNLRNFKNRIFFSSLKEKTLTLFK